MSGVLPVSEVFGPTIQGEGPHAGRSVLFLRLGGCNLSCSWCDTPYTWDATRFNLREECPPRTPGDIFADIWELAGPTVPLVISGGEPLLHQKNPAFISLLDALVASGREVHVETNGTVEPTAHVVASVSHFSVSPKLANAGDHKRSQSAAPWLGWAEVPHAVVKFVVRDKGDVQAAIHHASRLKMPRSRIWVMPEGTSAAVLNRRWPEIARAAADNQINASHRLHVLAWGDVKGT